MQNKICYVIRGQTVAKGLFVTTAKFSADAKQYADEMHNLDFGKDWFEIPCIDDYR